MAAVRNRRRDHRRISFCAAGGTIAIRDRARTKHRARTATRTRASRRIGDGRGRRARAWLHERTRTLRRRAPQRRKLAVHDRRVRRGVRDRTIDQASVAMNEIAIAVAIGIAFGFALERAGLGDARKLAGQFYFTDLTVLKVMFSAIVTAMLGVFWLARLGVIDLAKIYVPET